MKSILVTGASGQLGRCIRELSSNSENTKFIFADSADLDITQNSAVQRIFQKQKIDYCINCAAYTAVDKAESELKTAKKINFEGAKNLALACQKSGTVLMHISTDFVFDGEQEIPYGEDDPTNPINIYGKTKLEGEEAIRQVLQQYFIIRTSWLYSEYGNNFMKSMIKLGRERSELGIVNDQKGTPTYAKDLAGFLLFLIAEDSSSYGTYHYSNKGETTWHGFAQEIFKIEKTEIILKCISTAEYPTPAKRPKYSVLNKNKVEKTFKVQIPQWEASLQLALRNFKAQNAH